jgi:hypothetical protein
MARAKLRTEEMEIDELARRVRTMSAVRVTDKSR